MSWKREIKLSDLDDTQEIELTCQKCGIVTYQTPLSLLVNQKLNQLYLDEVETLLLCPTRVCRSHIKLSLVYESKTEGFVGGLA
jgi:hypothetical protein